MNQCIVYEDCNKTMNLIINIFQVLPRSERSGENQGDRNDANAIAHENNNQTMNLCIVHEDCNATINFNIVHKDSNKSMN